MFEFKEQEDAFIGFFDLNASEELSLASTYYIEIVQAKLVGDIVHLLVELWFEGEKQGLVTESYDVTSAEFRDLVKNFYAAEWKHVVSVSTGDLINVRGEAKLRTSNGHLSVDWKTFRPEETPCGDLFDYYEANA